MRACIKERALGSGYEIVSRFTRGDALRMKTLARSGRAPGRGIVLGAIVVAFLATPNGVRATTIYVARRGWHVDVGFATADLTPALVASRRGCGSEGDEARDDRGRYNARTVWRCAVFRLAADLFGAVHVQHLGGRNTRGRSSSGENARRRLRGASLATGEENLSTTKDRYPALSDRIAAARSLAGGFGAVLAHHCRTRISRRNHHGGVFRRRRRAAAADAAGKQGCCHQHTRDYFHAWLLMSRLAPGQGFELRCADAGVDPAGGRSAWPCPECPTVGAA